MRISDMIMRLNYIRDKYGDLPIVGGYLVGDCPAEFIKVVDAEDDDPIESGRPAVGVFIE